MLYPTTILDLASIQGVSCVAGGSALAIPITIPPVLSPPAATTGLLLAMVQMAPTQDYSIRAWVSLKPNGDFLPNNTSFWHLNRGNDQMIFVYDATQTIPSTLCNVNAITLAPGNYYLNILNLVNAENVFSFGSTEI